MLLKREKLDGLIKGVAEDAMHFVAPTNEAGQVVYRSVSEADAVVVDHILPVKPFKEFLFPQTEPVLTFVGAKGSVDLVGAEPASAAAVVFAARPCEAESTVSLGKVFNWDFIDEFFTRRAENTVIVSLACTRGDKACFCTSVGLAPDSTEGSDLALKETTEGDFVVETVTDKGKAFIEKYKTFFDTGAGAKPEAKKVFEPRKLEGVDLEKIRLWLSDKSNYEDPVWADLARKCIGCGACTYVCCTCHCFDITDEGSYADGVRRKNWDSCQFEHFTLHASGHNPRDTQFKRWRNRFLCKFAVYPGKFSSRGCFGCGRCIRVCPVRLDLTEAMEEISARG